MIKINELLLLYFFLFSIVTPLQSLVKLLQTNCNKLKDHDALSLAELACRASLHGFKLKKQNKTKQNKKNPNYIAAPHFVRLY